MESIKLFWGKGQDFTLDLMVSLGTLLATAGVSLS